MLDEAEEKIFGRPSILSEKQKQDARVELTAGLSVSAIARKFATCRQTVMLIREEAAQARRGKGRPDDGLFGQELDHLPPELRWREWMSRIEAVIFAASEPVPPEVLARVFGKSCNIELIIDDIRAERAGRPFELFSVAGGWQHRTKKAFADVIRVVTEQGADIGPRSKPLSQSEALVLMCIAYFQPITRGELASFFGKEVSRDLIGVPRSQDLIASGATLASARRDPIPTSLRRPFCRTSASTRCPAPCPNFATLEDVGLLSKEKLLADDIPVGLMSGEDDEELDIGASGDV